MRKLYDENRKHLQQLAPFLRPSLQPLGEQSPWSTGIMTCHLHCSEDVAVQSIICEI
jgi:hypothetical protein